MNRLSAKNIFRLFGIAVIALSLPIAIYLVDNETNFFKRASGEPANLEVGGETDPTSRVTNQWNNIAQGGSDETRMLEPIVGDLQHLSPEYIRIDHLYDRYNVVSRDGGGNIVLEWSNLDLTVNDILNTGAKPFFSLSYMPHVMASSGDVTDTPSSWSEWEYLVKETVEHYSGSNGLNIPMVYYEVWNEPDLFGNFKAGKGKNYFDLYLHAIRGAQSAKNTQVFKIGGPGTTSLYSSWFNKFISFVADNNLWLDYYSWHNYSQDLSDYERDLENISSWIKDFPGYSGIELVLSETGYSSELDGAHDGNKSAIHTLAMATVLDGKVDKTFSFQAKDNKGDTKYWGNWGLLTHEAYGEPIKKPRYLALEFLNRMVGDPIVVNGEGSWVKAFARKDGEVLRLLVVNYDPNDKHSESVPLSFGNLDESKYVFRRIDFRGVVHERSIDVVGGVWSTREYFESNSAAIFELSPEVLVFERDVLGLYDDILRQLADNKEVVALF